MSANMARIMKAQALKADSPFTMNETSKVFEVNPKHPVMKEIARRLVDVGIDAIKGVVLMLFNAALIACGFSLEDPSAFAKTLHYIVGVNMGVHDEEDKEEVGAGASVGADAETNDLETLD
jgi:molecular chaperone HtpG